jgi:hypothetical protein
MELIMYEALKVAFKNKDYVYQIIKHKFYLHGCAEFQILLDGMTQTIVKNQSGWTTKNSFEENADLIKAIGESISSRYQLE